MKKRDELLDEIRNEIDTELGSMPEIIEKDPEKFDVDKLLFGERKWHRLDDSGRWGIRPVLG